MVRTNQLPLLSAIVPVGNLAKDQENLLRWVSKIKNESLEVIIVLDKASYANQDVINKFRKQIVTKSVAVLTGDNAGPGSARNIGLDSASGKWIIFWDADDLPNVKNVLSALENLNGGEYDLLVGQFDIESLGVKPHAKLKSLDNKSTSLEQVALNPGLWRMCFNSESIASLRFPKIYMGEDQVFIAEFFTIERKILHVESLFYTYRIGDEGQLTSSRLHQQEIVFAIRNIASFLPNSGNQNFIHLQFVKMIASGLFRGSIKTQLETLRIIFFHVFVSRRLSIVELMRCITVVWRNRHG